MIQCIHDPTPPPPFNVSGYASLYLQCVDSAILWITQDLEMLKGYKPWGKPSGGAPRVSGWVLSVSGFKFGFNFHFSCLKVEVWMRNIVACIGRTMTPIHPRYVRTFVDMHIAHYRTIVCALYLCLC